MSLCAFGARPSGNYSSVRAGSAAWWAQLFRFFIPASKTIGRERTRSHCVYLVVCFKGVSRQSQVSFLSAHRFLGRLMIPSKGRMADGIGWATTMVHYGCCPSPRDLSPRIGSWQRFVRSRTCCGRGHRLEGGRPLSRRSHRQVLAGPRTARRSVVVCCCCCWLCLRSPGWTSSATK